MKLFLPQLILSDRWLLIGDLIVLVLKWIKQISFDSLLINLLHTFSELNMLVSGIMILRLILSVKSLKQSDHLITDFSQQTCIDLGNKGSTFYYWISKDNGLPYCAKYRKEGM